MGDTAHLVSEPNSRSRLTRPTVEGGNSSLKKRCRPPCAVARLKPSVRHSSSAGDAERTTVGSQVPWMSQFTARVRMSNLSSARFRGAVDFDERRRSEGTVTTSASMSARSCFGAAGGPPMTFALVFVSRNRGRIEVRPGTQITVR